jgi:hypothetical protein
VSKPQVGSTDLARTGKEKKEKGARQKKVKLQRKREDIRDGELEPITRKILYDFPSGVLGKAVGAEAYN